ncbi:MULTISPECIES: hypothetical protein [Aquabacterium]|jgi:hypothetical protein|nr:MULTISPECIES: hypothetical protein [Aquabacterium]MBT9608512.1 hypothetical protein [Aquabacterium sp.]|tara:strand:- start:745 stop:984 length:240 start_codon:yes stop_codon:yes gene_type:complete
MNTNAATTASASSAVSSAQTLPAPSTQAAHGEIEVVIKAGFAFTVPRDIREKNRQELEAFNSDIEERLLNLRVKYKFEA